jgi:flagellar biosynthesis protein FlhG
LLAGGGSGRRLDELGSARLAGFVQSVVSLATDFDHVLVDLPSGLERIGPLFVESSARLVIVGNNEPTSLTDNYAFIKLTRGRAPTPQFLANAVDVDVEGRCAHLALARACRRFLDLNCGYLGSVRRDPRVAEAIRRQRPLLGLFPMAPAAQDVDRAAMQIDAQITS